MIFSDHFETAPLENSPTIAKPGSAFAPPGFMMLPFPLTCPKGAHATVRPALE